MKDASVDATSAEMKKDFREVTHANEMYLYD